MKSFEIGNYVYFFFRERTLECSSCGKLKISRVARICKVIICKLSIKKYPNGLERYFWTNFVFKSMYTAFSFSFSPKPCMFSFLVYRKGYRFLSFWHEKGCIWGLL